MANSYVTVSNASSNAVSLEGALGDERVSVKISVGGSETVYLKDLIGNATLCDDLATFVTAGTLTVTRGSNTLTATQITNFKYSGDMYKSDYDADDDSVPDSAEEISYVNVTAIDDTDSPYTVLSTDNMIEVDSTGGAVVVNLPAGVEAKQYTIKDAAGGANSNNITINPDGVETIEGAGSATIGQNWASVTYYFDDASSDWKVIGQAKYPTPVRTAHEQAVAATSTDHAFIAPGPGRITAFQCFAGTGAAAAESMDLDVQINGVSALTAAVTVDNAAGTNVQTGTVDTAVDDIVAGDVVTVARTYVAGGGPAPMADTVAEISYELS